MRHYTTERCPACGIEMRPGETVDALTMYIGETRDCVNVDCPLAYLPIE